MAQFYQVLNRDATAFTLEELRHMCPNIQCIDGGNGNIQYIINDDSAVQFHNHVIGIDQTGAAIQLEAYQQPVVLDSSIPQQSVYVIEAVDPSTQRTVNQQVLAAHPNQQFVLQQLQQQIQPAQSCDQSQQTSDEPETQTSILYGRQTDSNGLALEPTHLSTTAVQVSGTEESLGTCQAELSETTPTVYEPKFSEKEAIGKHQQTQLLTHNSAGLHTSLLQFPNGQKISLSEWQQHVLHQQQHLQLRLQQEQSQIQSQTQEQQDQQLQQSNQLQLQSPLQTHQLQDPTHHLQDQTPHLQDQTPHLQDQTPHLQDQTPHVQDHTPHLQDQTSRLQDQTSHVQDQTSRLQDQTPRLQDQTPHLQDQTPHLQDQTPQLQDQTPQLQDQTPQLQDQTSQLQDQPHHLQDQSHHLQDQPHHLQDQPHHLQDQTHHLPEQTCQLQNQTHQLQNQIPQLQNQISQLQNQTHQLQNQISQLQDQTHLVQTSLRTATQHTAQQLLPSQQLLSQSHQVLATQPQALLQSQHIIQQVQQEHSQQTTLLHQSVISSGSIVSAKKSESVSVITVNHQHAETNTLGQSVQYRQSLSQKVQQQSLLPSQQQVVPSQRGRRQVQAYQRKTTRQKQTIIQQSMQRQILQTLHSQHSQQHLTQQTQTNKEMLKSTSPTPRHPTPGARRTYNNRSRLKAQNTLVTNNTVQAIAFPTAEPHQNLVQQNNNVVSVVEQPNQALPMSSTKEVQQQEMSNQYVILLANRERPLLKLEVRQSGNHSVKEILDQVGLNLDSNVAVLNLPDKRASDQSLILQANTTANNTGIHDHLQEDIIEKQIVPQNALTNVQTVQQSIQRIITAASENLLLPKPVITEKPKYVEGMLAICQHCGYTSVDFNRCQRCKRKLPDCVKSTPVKKKVIFASHKEKAAAKTAAKLETETNRTVKKRGTSVRKARKLVEEPVILTLSSDEEDQRQSDLDGSCSDRSSSNHHPLLTDNSHFLSSDQSVTYSAMGKEPVIPGDETDVDMSENNQQVLKGDAHNLDLESIIDGSAPGEYTLLHCRTVRIGSYKVVPKDKVILSSIGIRISVPSIEDEKKSVILNIGIKEILKVLIHFGRGMPVLFFYIIPAAATRIRDVLKMDSKTGPYYDPSSSDETQKRITLLPERLHEESKVILKLIFGNLNVMAELNNKEANDILVRASPKEVQNLMRKAAGFSSPVKPVGNEIQTIMVYPPHPAKGGIPINTEDYACLGEDQFLNDVIIDFYLKYLTLSVLSKEDHQRTHVFSTFFYKRLTTRPGRSGVRRAHPIEDDPKLSAAEKRHSRVKSWTKNVNLFEKDFIVIPINEHCHWFLAIICFPGLSSPVRMSDDTPVTEPVGKAVRDKKKGAEPDILNKPVQIGSTTITPVKCPDTITLDPGEEGSDRDEAEGDDEDMDHGTSDEEDGSIQDSNNVEKCDTVNDKAEQLPKPSKQIREAIKQPCILIFDSLAGASRTRVVATLRDYLRIEYRIKEGKERDFSKDTIKGACPKVPQQTNFTDCGLYLLQYVESFFQDPIKDYRLPMRALVNWFSEGVVNRKREEIHKLLLLLMEQNGVDINNLNLPKLTFPTSQSDESNKSMTSNEDNSIITSQEEPVEDSSATGNEEKSPPEVTTKTDDVASPEKMDSANTTIGSSAELHPQPLNTEKGNRLSSLVDYSDDSDEKSMIVDSESSDTLVKNKKSNSLLTLKSKRIEKCSGKLDDDVRTPKRIRTDNTIGDDNR